jgi:transcriptional regulator with XRE-family HTH domain
MAGRNKWDDLIERMPAERRERIKRRVEAELAAMELGELRVSRGITQEELAERLASQQPAISRLEHQRDIRVSTLREVVEAMGGELVITARFPDAEVRLTQWQESATS